MQERGVTKKGAQMIYSLHAVILRNGYVVRHEIARPATVARYLADVRDLSEYQVIYYLNHRFCACHWRGFSGPL